MSRHKFVKTLNLDNELDDYDGGASYGENEDEEEISAEDKKKLQDGKAQVQSILGPKVAASDEEIEECLWHYYYDVAKTVTYILDQRSSQSKKSKKKKKTEGAEAKIFNGRHEVSSTLLISCYPPTWRIGHESKVFMGSIASSVAWKTPIGFKRCYSPSPVAEFFKDSPWLNIPKERRGEILIEPLYPRGRLLGGSPAQGGKVSKLAALAAARKKKDQEKNQDASFRTSTTSVALLDKLGGRAKIPAENVVRSDSEMQVPQDRNPEQIAVPPRLSRPVRKRKCSDTVFPKEEESSDSQNLPTPGIGIQEPRHPVVVPIAAPSMFARVMFGISDKQELPSKRLKHMIFTLPQGPKTYAEINPFAGPSPDDIVSKAQQNSKGLKQKGGTQKQQNGGNSVKSATKGIDDIKIDAPKAKSKNLNVIAEFEKSKPKNAASFVVIGHVDAGKSTLMGRLLYDLEVVDQRTIDIYRKEAESIGKSSFALAWVLDQGTEERNRGVTIDIATNKFETEQTKFTILDAPGHRDFIPNMIAGASQADFAVLVIDASTGSFESGLKGQTREHALLVRSMGVSRLIVVVNKLDTVGWSQDRFTEISTQLSAFLTAAGFQAKNIAFVPCSGLTGENITQPSHNPLLTSWYQGPSLLALLDASEPITRALSKPLRLTINDVFRGSITNPLSISGRIESGSVQTGEVVLVMPSSETATIRAIEVEAEPVDWAVAGQNATLHLADIESKFLKHGDVICHPAAPIKNITTFTTKILAFGHVMPMFVEVHRGRLQTPGRITQLLALLDKGSGGVTKKKPRMVKPGGVARVMVELEEVVPLEAPGRVILRAGGETVAAGLLE